MRPGNAEHVVIKAPRGGGAPKALCLHCGGEYLVSIPCPLEVFLAISEAFTGIHKECSPPKDDASVPSVRGKEA